MYLNSQKPFHLFKSEASSYYYVDKSLMLDELWFGKKYICVARPRRFGKSVAAAMIASYFSKGVNANALFSKLKISQTSSYSENLNKFNVIYISLNELPFPCETYSDYISNIRDSLLEELHKAYPDAKSLTADPIELLAQLNELKGETFVFVLDEWDYVFEAMFMTEQDKRNYMSFLRDLLVGPYASLVYMTGVIPISKHSSSSELAMFSEFTMESPKFSKHFGFSESEVTDLHTRYLSATPKGERHVTRKGLRQWYKGYWTPGNNMIYNPQTVVEALMVNQLGSYWINTGPFNEISRLVKSNIAEMRRDLALLVSHEGVPLDFAQCIMTPSLTLTTRDEALSAMAVYGLLSIGGAKAFVPNKEIMDKFASMMKNERALGYIHVLASQSTKMLKAILDMDKDTICAILDDKTESPIFDCSNETDLSAIVNLACLSARSNYDIVRKNEEGKGFADFLFFPRKRADDRIILELKTSGTPESAIKGLKERGYLADFRKSKKKYQGRLILVGIAYDIALKKHGCVVEEILT